MGRVLRIFNRFWFAEASATRLESELRLRAHERLREAGVFA